MPPRRKGGRLDDESGRSAKKKAKSSVAWAIRERVEKHVDQIAQVFSRATPGTPATATPLDGVRVIRDPFPICVISSFFADEALLRDARDAILELPLVPKCNDLYHFHQSPQDLWAGPVTRQAIHDDDDDEEEEEEDEEEDESECEAAIITDLRTFMKDRVRPWVRDLSGGVPVDKHRVDGFFAFYGRGDHLLCHDDQLETRRYAYVLYLVDEDYSADDGGALEVFGTDDAGRPLAQAAHAIIPKWNQLVIFEVSRRSWHRVAEIVSTERPRLSITGWFHGPRQSTSPVSHDTPLALALPHANLTQDPDVVLSSWISSDYTVARSVKKIRRLFESTSSCQLCDFLLPARAHALNTAFKATLDGNSHPDTAQWALEGSPERQHFHTLRNTRDGPIGEMYAFLTSAVFVGYLHRLTGLDLTQCTAAVACFAGGDYTLMHDGAEARERLDAVLYGLCGMQGAAAEKEDDDDESDAVWDSESGGYTSYASPEETEELLSVLPAENTLSLVFRVPPAMRFIKYLSVNAPRQPLVLFDAVYCE